MEMPANLYLSFSQRIVDLKEPYTDMTTNIEINVFSDRTDLRELRVAHRDLDVAIAELSKNIDIDQIRVTRLKKRKLAIKDMIVRLESELIPDLDA